MRKLRHWGAPILPIAVLATVGLVPQPSRAANENQGINIALNAPYLLPPKSLSEPQLEGDNRARLDLARREGFNVVRLRYHMSLLNTDKRAAILDAMSKFVVYANDHALRVYVALQDDNGHQGEALICQQQNWLVNTALEVAKALPDRPDAGIEPFNEPPSGCGPAGSKTRWEAVQLDLYRRIRSIRPHITYVASGGNWGTLDGLLALDPELYVRDPNVLFSFHFYEPFLFTGQGQAGLFPGSDINVQNFPWPYDSSSVSKAESVALQQLQNKSLKGPELTLSKSALLAQYRDYERTGTSGYIKSRFESVSKWAKEHKLDPHRIYIGEFGVIRPTRDTSGSPNPSAAAWLHAVVMAAQQEHFVWVIFDLDSSYAVLCTEKNDQHLCDSYKPALISDSR